MTYTFIIHFDFLLFLALVVFFSELGLFLSEKLKNMKGM